MISEVRNSLWKYPVALLAGDLYFSVGYAYPSLGNQQQKEMEY
jgi:hypothetical protein